MKLCPMMGGAFILNYSSIRGMPMAFISIYRRCALVALLVSSLVAAAGQDVCTKLVNSNTDITWNIWGLLREESFAGKDIVFLNNNNPEDQNFYFRHTWDTNASVCYGSAKYGCHVAEFKSTLRQRTIWGFASSTARTTDTEVKVADVVTSPHAHDLPRLFIWMREGWLKFDLNAALGLSFANKHSLTLGAFPFELGRGIALGAAYALGPTPLGFYSDSVIDQFAFGIKLSGDLVKNVLKYDVYGSILQARSTSISETGKKIYGQEIGRLNSPMRGFGKDNYLVAARVMWTVFNNEHGTLSFEPYVMYNNDPEQKIEFEADASSRLGTWGVAGEYEGCKLGCGFDMAFNMGRQSVKGWDRNKVDFKNIDGYLAEINTQVLTGPDGSGSNVLFIPNSADQKIIFNAELDGGQEQSQNGKLIVPSTTLYNGSKRYRDAYYNQYKGMMAVADASYYLYKKDLKAAITVGYASGDQDPNFEVIDGTFDGFIGLQEIYLGKRVKSVFLLGQVGKVKRPGSEPVDDNSPKDFSTSFSGFTNIAFWGSGFTWTPCDSRRKFTVNPNVFMYWEPSPGNKYDAKTQQDLSVSARKFLGTEANAFVSAYLFENLKIWGIGSVFFPDGHYTDIKGKPLNRDQQRALNRLNSTGFSDDKIPNIGDDIGFTANIGIDYTF